MLQRAKSTISARFDRLSEQSDALNNSLSAYAAPSQQSQANGGQDYDDPNGAASKIIADIRGQMKRGIPSVDLKAVNGIIDALRHTNAIDDRKLLLENALMIMSRLPNSAFKSKLQNSVVELLYHDLSHPPSTYLGNQHAWRTADGSHNNVTNPDIGKAGSHYSRSVQQQHPLPPSMLPDPGLLFDSLLKRAKYTEHPGGLSSMMFSFAVLVIHTCFRTSPSDWSVNQTSSYVDLAPLYGWSEETQMSVRNVNGLGLLKPDSFAEDRLLFLPPAASVVLVLLNRNHNYIAAKLLVHNEKGTFNPDLSQLSQDKIKSQDDELFNVARLINCAWFANMVFSDYFSTILGLCRFGSSWFLNPFDEIRKEDHELVERGMGNSVTVEFNLLYRWHATLSQVDEKWISTVFDKVFQGKPYSELSIGDYASAMGSLQKTVGADVTTWTFGNLKRGEDGKFKDEDLARLLCDAISQPASAFGARNTPEVLRIVEIMTIKQSRTWGVCNLNEFRKYLGLKPYVSFDEWNSNKEVADTARRIYGDIENLELHVGLQAEEAKPLVPGAGLCPGYTVSRAILADAIALTRGDRFYTTDFTPYNLTSWGFTDCQREDNNPSFGGMLGKLFLRTLPDHFTHNNVYTWFPLMTPESMQKNLTNLGLNTKYTFDRPVTEVNVVPVSRYTAVSESLKSEKPEEWGTTYTERAESVGLGKGFYIALKDGEAARALHREVVQGLLGTDGVQLKKHSAEMAKLTIDMINERSFTLVGYEVKNVDIVRDVLNVMPLHWVSKLTGLDLKTRENPRGSYVEVELSQMFQEIYNYVFFEGDPAHQMQLHDLVQQHSSQLLRSIKAHAGNPRGTIFGSLSSIIFGSGSKNSAGDNLQAKLYAAGHTEDEVANILFAIAVGSTVEYSQALIHVVNLYLEDKYKAEADAIRKLALQSGDDHLLEGYVREALRLDPPIPGVHRDAKLNSFSSDGAKFNRGGRYYLSIANANMDYSIFPNPEKVDPSRPAEAYLIGDTALRCLGEDFIIKPMAQVLKAIFGLKNLRRGPGVSGILNRSGYQQFDTTQYEYMDRKQRMTLWAQSMIVQYDVKA